MPTRWLTNALQHSAAVINAAARLSRRALRAAGAQKRFHPRFTPAGVKTSASDAQDSTLQRIVLAARAVARPVRQPPCQPGTKTSAGSMSSALHQPASSTFRIERYQSRGASPACRYLPNPAITSMCSTMKERPSSGGRTVRAARSGPGAEHVPRRRRVIDEQSELGTDARIEIEQFVQAVSPMRRQSMSMIPR